MGSHGERFSSVMFKGFSDLTSAPSPVCSIYGHLFGFSPYLPPQYLPLFSTVFRQVVFWRPTFPLPSGDYVRATRQSLSSTF